MELNKSVKRTYNSFKWDDSMGSGDILEAESAPSVTHLGCENCQKQI